MKLMPDYIPLSLHRPAVIVSGVFEVLLGVMLLIPRTQTLAAWGLIALLIAIFLAISPRWPTTMPFGRAPKCSAHSGWKSVPRGNSCVPRLAGTQK
jgi:uncharacterized membrane protein